MVKTLRKFFLTLIIIALLVIGFVALAFNKQGYTINNSSAEGVINKITVAEKEEKAIALTKDEINSLFSMVYKNPKQKGDVIIKTPQVDLEEDKVIAKIPVTYKSMEVVLWTKGSVSQNGEHIIYSPDSFKVGKLTVPKAVVISKLKSKLKDENIIIEDYNILVNKKAFPFFVADINVGNNTMNIKISKISPSLLFDGGKSAKIELDKLKDELNSLKEKGLTAEQNQKIQEVIDKINKNINSNSREILQNIVKDIDNISKSIKDGNKKQQVEKVKEEASKKQEEINKNQAQAKASLARLSGQLSAAQSAVSSPVGKQAIGIMVSTAGKMASNPYYNYGGDAAAARGLYNKLTPQEKAQVKNAIFSNVDMNNVSQIRQLLGM
ncbi:hypothetical protein [Clostridium sp. HMP27]|uniref:hypothetical protein n=1 Tax=Clostridium sp. HMP27 TaxID=1487921 RepID=UPI00052DA563|nr:hypothetical protein [Clostridium sp. HMP27]KGK89551.1 hypothetical protein DP68_03570 [Clostridium sp. HMP27]